MKQFSIFILIGLSSLVTWAQDRIDHECVPRKPNEEIAKVLILYSPAQPYGKEFLEIYGSEGPKLKVEVQYGDDMTYIAYSNEVENVYFDRDWPVENNQGTGYLQLGSWQDPNRKNYILDCSSPDLN